ncbi:MAG TPA: Spy/CpxP family protein refolding chaperone [Thermoanaerobaculia bacterium]
MRKTVVLGAIMLAMATLATAGGPRARRHRIAHVLHEVQWTDAQRAELKALRERRRAAAEPLRDAVRAAASEYRALKEANDPRASAVRNEIQNLRDELQIMRISFRGDFERILTAEQKAKLKAMRAKRRERRRD